jgi:hypothetical protein
MLKHTSNIIINHKHTKTTNCSKNINTDTDTDTDINTDTDTDFDDGLNTNNANTDNNASSDDNDTLEMIIKDLYSISEIQGNIQAILENDKNKLNKIQNIQQNISSMEDQSLVDIKEAKQYNIRYKKILFLGIAGIIMFSPIGGILPLIFL